MFCMSERQISGSADMAAMHHNSWYQVYMETGCHRSTDSSVYLVCLHWFTSVLELGWTPPPKAILTGNVSKSCRLQ